MRQEHDWRVGSKPFVRFARKLDRLLMPDHPSGQWMIGTRRRHRRILARRARAFHRTWYVLNNVDFVVMADIDAGDAEGDRRPALAGLAPRPLPPRAFAKQPAIVNERTDIVEEDAAIKRAGVYFKKLVRIEEGDVYATGAVRTLVTSFLTSRLPGSLYDALVDKGKLAAGAPSVAFARVAPKTFTLTIGADVGARRRARDGCWRRFPAMSSNWRAPASPAETLDAAQDPLRGRPRHRRQGSAAWSTTAWSAGSAGRNRYENLARWPAQIDAVSPRAGL